MTAISALSCCGEIGASGLLIDGEQFLARFDHFGQQRQFIGAADDLAGAARFDLALLERRHHEAKRADPDLVARLHRLFHLRRHRVAHRNRFGHGSS